LLVLVGSRDDNEHIYVIFLCYQVIIVNFIRICV